MKYCDDCNQIVPSDAKHCPNWVATKWKWDEKCDGELIRNILSCQVQNKDGRIITSCQGEVFLTEEQFEAKRQFIASMIKPSPSVKQTIMGDEVNRNEL